MKLFVQSLPPRASLGVLLLRVIIGLAFVVHGLPKIQHPASWMSIALGPHAFAPPFLQVLATVAEFFGGIALILGFLTPVAAVAILIDMTVALLKVHLPSGAHWIGGPGSFETPLFYLVAMIALLCTGPGQYSIDAALARASLSRRVV